MLRQKMNEINGSPPIDATRIPGVAVGDKARYDHAVGRAVERSRLHFAP
jgi:hypothetical protein